MLDLSAMARKIHWEKARASLNTVCTKCGYPIPPQEIRRVTFYEVLCPKCGERFIPGWGREDIAPGRFFRAAAFLLRTFAAAIAWF